MSHHYAIVAVKLVEQCLEQIQGVIDSDERSRPLHPSNSSLYDMKVALTEIESHLFCYFNCIIEKEVENSTSPRVHEMYQTNNPCTDLSSCVVFLQFVLKEASLAAAEHAGHPAHSYYPRRSATDSLLFRLNVALQLCLVRIDDARFVICGERISDRQSILSRTTSYQSIYRITSGLLGLSTLASMYMWRYPKLVASQNLQLYKPYLQLSSKVLVSIFTIQWFHKKWNNTWMVTKLVKSTEEIEEWTRQWTLVQSTPIPRSQSSTPQVLQKNVVINVAQPCSDGTCTNHDNLLDAARSQRLIEYALHETAKSSFWHSQGELRFLMVKRAMDVFYASVGTAMNITGSNDKTIQYDKDAAKWQLTLVTAAVASFYSVTGARDKAAAVTSSSETASYLIRNAWGMVSLPAVKNLSLQASRLLKGASVADRIEICGVHCFVLSSDPAPELAAAIKRNHRLHQRRKPIATLSTIDEQEEHTPCTNRRPCSTTSFVRSSSRRYRQRDVIFHLTGGGFFAHIHSTDLPYLLDWSAATGSVVICPEYALLPEHTFPVALNQVEEVYQALVSDEAVSVLGFELNRIIVTGESAGGNLAASLCVKLCTDRMVAPSERIDYYQLVPRGNTVDTTAIPVIDAYDKSLDKGENVSSCCPNIRLPDALMLSCPVLNLSLEMSHSRVIGTDDPVLPSGLISAISDAYLPTKLGVSKKDPLASPFYASNEILHDFPPTLLFASSNDPLLDDSVVFNQRLREQNVDSDLIAAHNLPHAYLGLGTAGFPEAQQIQEKCIQWLNRQFTKAGT